MTSILIYCLILGPLLGAYAILAKRLNIVDKPNHRSSHTRVTIRGGGVVFPLAVLAWYIKGLILGESVSLLLLLAVLCIAIISFIDDIHTITPLPRLAVHVAAVSLVLLYSGFENYSIFYWVLAYILFIGWINAFNFMDGINGITTLYSLAVISPIWYIHEWRIEFLPIEYFYALVAALLVFGFANVRRKALMFAGDVGSVSIALMLGGLLILLVKAGFVWEAIAFVSIYGIDAVLTILQRLVKRENIFKAHRSHLYQFLANEKSIPHVAVAFIYALLQLGLSFVVVFTSEQYKPTMVLLSLVVLSGLYIPVKKWASRVTPMTT